jgi:hypothetical protein
MNLALFLWNIGLLQWYQCSSEVTTLCQASQWRETTGAVCSQRAHLDKGYYLADGIYLKWAVFVKPLISPWILKNKTFTMHRRLLRRMSREHFWFCMRKLPLWEVQRISRSKRFFDTSWWIEWSCITWSLRTSMVKMWMCVTMSWWGIRCRCDSSETLSLASWSATTQSVMKIPMKIFRRIAWRSGGHGGGNKGVVDDLELCDKLYVFMDELRGFVVTMCVCELICVQVDDGLFI